VWVDLAILDGDIVQDRYGSGVSVEDAAASARWRWKAEQEGGKPPGRRLLP
jgi:hypothetical protein